MITINQNKLKEIENEKARANRASAFAKEHDPMIGKVLRGEADAAELTTIAAEIRARFPYQE